MTKNKQSLASMKYDKANVKWINLKLNKNTDVDILNYLENITIKQGYIKKLIRKDMEKNSK